MMSALGSGGYTFLAFALVISAVVFFHELGHLLVGKLLGVKAVKFSIGFGPKLLGFRAGETEYRVSALPLGGFVKFAGDNPYEELAPEDRGRGFLEQPAWKRAAIAVAGPLANFVLALAVYVVLFSSPHVEPATKVGYVKPESPAARAGLRYGDRILSVDGERVSGWFEMSEKIGARAGEPLDLLLLRDGHEERLRIVPAVHEETGPIETLRRGRIGISGSPRKAEVTVTSPDSPAGRGGVRTFDLVVQLDGQPVANYEELARTLAAKTGPVSLLVLRRSPVEAPGATLWATAPVRLELPAPAAAGAYGLEPGDLTVFAVQPGSAAAEAGLRRGDRVLSADGRAVYSWADELEGILKTKGTQPVTLEVRRDGKPVTLTVTQHLRKGRDDAGVRVDLPELGAAPGAILAEGESVRVRRPLPDAVVRSFGATAGLVRAQVLGIVRIVTGHISSEAIGGPLMIADVARQAAEAGWMAVLYTIAAISVALGVMNLLPVPVLDGFHVLSAAIEGLRRRPLPVKFREYANMVGIALLLSLMLFAFRNDAMRKWFD